MKKTTKLLLASLTLTCTLYANEQESKPIILSTMGSLFYGGDVKHFEDGETFHGEHGYAQYFIPKDSYSYPLIMWHGIGQSGKTFESTPDGRDGFMQIFTRKNWSVYIIDQPRRGRAGRTTTQANPNASPTIMRESSAFNAFRLGIWAPPKKPEFFETLAFPTDPTTIDQFFRQQTPTTGAEPRTAKFREWMAQQTKSLLDMSGEAILITHSNSGQYGWESAMLSPEKVKAVVAYEPGAFAFFETPPEVEYKAEGVNEAMAPRMVSKEKFLNLTKMPILIIYGDNIATKPSEIFNEDVWRIATIRAKQFVEAINANGGDATLVILPQIGIKGNTHIPFADLNNMEIAEHLEAWLKEKKLDKRDKPHKKPTLTKIEKSTIPLK